MTRSDIKAPLCRVLPAKGRNMLRSGYNSKKAAPRDFCPGELFHRVIDPLTAL